MRMVTDNMFKFLFALSLVFAMGCEYELEDEDSHSHNPRNPCVRIYERDGHIVRDHRGCGDDGRPNEDVPVRLPDAGTPDAQECEHNHGGGQGHDDCECEHG